MVWADTTKLGCGASKYLNDKGYNTLYLVCNYGPSGNVEDETTYST